MYTSNQKFDNTRILVIHDIKNLRKIILLKMSKINILHKIMSKSYLKNPKKNCHINNQVKHPFIILNEFIDFSEFI